MRGSATPTSPGSWDPNSEALLAPPAPAPPAASAASAGPASAASAPAVPAVTAVAAEAIQQVREVRDVREGAPQPAADAVPTPAPGAVRHGNGHGPERSADPVKALLHRHRDLCRRAVDPLEIAAGLEAHGMTDRTAAWFRHRDVFSLAEELYARVPQDDTDGTDGTEDTDDTSGRADTDGTAIPAAPRTTTWAIGATWTDRAGWALAACAPGAAALLATAGLALTTGPARLAAGVLGALATVAALFLAVRRGPLTATGPLLPAAALWTLWLLAYAAAGDGFLDQVLRGGPDHAPALVTPLDTPLDPAGTGGGDAWVAAGAGGAWDVDTGPLLALALAVAPAVWCARVFAVRARRRLAVSRGPAAFAAGTRPLLLGAVAAPVVVLAGLLALTGFHPGALALGALLLTARLLVAYGFTEAASLALGATCAAEALAVASVLAARLPGCAVLGVPVRAVTGLWGPAALPVLLCGTAALALLVHATTALSRASAHS
ncbi:hypothetical protein ACGFRB_28520 [Streptomyces sp. NPDC048718]|uniref:hypothetical protein n=1 Tax=Streptomyces sp. NPDC048718 TaxID=3365587 RepID=UPI00372291B5